MNKNLVLVIAACLVLFGIFKPDLSWVNNPPSDNTVVVEAPKDPVLLEHAMVVVEVLKNGGDDRKVDGKRLSSLYLDLATLIELDGNDRVIKNTEEIRQANQLSGLLLRMDIKGKYTNLSTSSNDLIISSIGDENMVLSVELRKQAVEAFRALSWACDSGSK